MKRHELQYQTSSRKLHGLGASYCTEAIRGKRLDMVVVSHNTIHYTVWKPKLDAIVSALTRSLYVRSRLTAVSSHYTNQLEIKNMNVTNEMIISQEISALEQQIRYVNEMKSKLKEAKEDLANSYLGIIIAKEEFERTKKQNLEEVRSYKFATATELKEIQSNFKFMTDGLTKEKIDNLTKFVSACEDLQELRAKGFFDSFSFNNAD